MTINHESMPTADDAQCADSPEPTATLSPAEIAAYLAIDPKSLRSFIRKNALAADHAHRSAYAFSPDDARMIIAAYRNRSTATANRSTRSIDAIAALID